MTVHAKRVTKVSLTMPKAANKAATKPPTHPSSQPARPSYGIPDLGPPSDQPRTSVAQRPDVRPPPKFSPGSDSGNSKWMAAPPPPNSSDSSLLGASKKGPNPESGLDIRTGQLAVAL